ncbi:IS1595 family transposase [Paenibacillus sp. FSL M8-0334]|uniref:IS1595 family transposase n=1 Tax=Paenibacillus sp. FSL M8-0334 TaxID=2921623 RepID=UPI0030F79ED7
MTIHTGTGLQPFYSRYQSEQDCMEALIAMKWPSGFVCPRCDHTGCSRLNSRRVPLFECGRCKHQTSALVGTIFEGTRVPLLKWFMALDLFLLPDGISAMRLCQVIEVTYKTAWLMLHKIRYAVGEFDARELLYGDVKVNSDQYGRNPSRVTVSHPHASAVVAGCTVTESGEPQQVRFRLVPQKRGSDTRAARRDLTAFISEHVDSHSSDVELFSQAFRLYAPLRNIVRETWKSLKSTYGALGQKHLQAYLNEFTARRQLHLSKLEKTMGQILLQKCMVIPRISYHQLIGHRPIQPLAAVA